MVNVNGSSRFKVPKKSVVAYCQSLLESRGLDPRVVLNVAFVGRRKMREIASNYKNEDLALPVLSFTYNQKLESGEELLGEIILCFPQVVLLAAERNKKVEDMLNQLIEHGLKNILNEPHAI